MRLRWSRAVAGRNALRGREEAHPFIRWSGSWVDWWVAMEGGKRKVGDGVVGMEFGVSDAGDLGE